MMRTKLYTILLAAAVCFIGCREEFVPNRTPSRDVPDGQVRFILPRTGQSVTYPTRATSVAGDANEYHISSLTIYQFDVHTGVYEDAFVVDGSNNDPRVHGADQILNGTGTNERSFAIDLGPDLDAVKHFYMVANYGAAASNTQLGLLTLNANTTTAAQFEAALTSLPTGFLRKGSYLPMYSNALNGTKAVYYIEVDPAGIVKAGYPVTMKRAIARIDVLNYAVDATPNDPYDDALVTNYTVDSLVINYANTKGNVFPAATLYNGSMSERVTVNINNTGDVIDSINRPTIQHNGDQPATIVPHAACYILPTRLNATTSKMYVVGKFSGSPMLLPVSLPEGVTNDTIAANKIYRINIQKINSKNVIAELIVADYDDQSELGTAPVHKMSVGSFYDVTGGKTPAPNLKVDSLGYTNVSPSLTEPTVIQFTVSSQSANAKPYITGWKEYAVLSMDSAKYKTKPTPHYERVFRISLPYKDHSPIINDTLIIHQPATSGTRAAKGDTLARFVIKTYVPQYMNSGYYPVLLGGIWWAPLSVGQTTIPATGAMASTPMTTAIGGYVYQWGRPNAPFDLDKGNPAAAAGPVSAEIANATPNVFYTHTLDWNTTHDATLWGGKNNVQGPCPDGWRMPTKDEIRLLPIPTVMNSGSNQASPNWFAVTGDDGKSQLYFGARGHINGDGTIGGIGSSCHMWTTTADPTTAGQAYEGYYAETTIILRFFTRVFAFTVRCVADNTH